MNNEEDFAYIINNLWKKWDEGEITKHEFNKQISLAIKHFNKNISNYRIK